MVRPSSFRTQSVVRVSQSPKLSVIFFWQIFHGSVSFDSFRTRFVLGVSATSLKKSAGPVLSAGARVRFGDIDAELFPRRGASL